MKIGIFSDRYLPQTDGISVSIETFRSQLEKLGHQVYVFAPRPSWRYKERSKGIIRFAAVKGLFFDDWLTSFFFPPQAIRQIDRLKLDIIHCQTPSAIGLLGAYYAMNKNIPLVATHHTDLYEYVKHYPQVLPGTILLSMLAPMITGGDMEAYRQALSSIKPERSIEKWNQKIVVQGLTLFHNRCDLVITPSRKMQKQLEGWHTASRIVTLPTGVDKITTTKREITATRKKFGLQEGDKIILLVCRIGTEKNIELLIKSFDVVGARLPKTKLVITGPGDDLKHYQDMAAKGKFPDRVIFTGFVEHQKLGALYSLASVFAFPSLTDTQGISVNEAACAGAPIVMVDREISEVVINEENGFFARKTPRDFAAKIIHILDDNKLQKRMSARSIELSKTVSARNQAIKLQQLYAQTIEQHHAKQATKSIKP